MAHKCSIDEMFDDMPRKSIGNTMAESRSRPWVTLWLEHPTPDRKVWVRCLMPLTLRVHTDSMPKLWRWRSVVSPSIVKKSNLSHRPWQHSFLPSLRNFTELSRTVTCMVTGVHLAPCQDEFREPRSDYVRQVALETTKTPEHTPYHPHLHTASKGGV
ncbi:hypothetical protein TNCV_1611401 [Trichonephila clavipes]|nr:hypothetical protein TNCV_1611401 [Trichonephila clavipes]